MNGDSENIKGEGVQINRGGISMNGEGVQINRGGISMNGEGVQINRGGICMNGEGVQINRGGISMNGEGVNMKGEGVNLMGEVTGLHSRIGGGWGGGGAGPTWFQGVSSLDNSHACEIQNACAKVMSKEDCFMLWMIFQLIWICWLLTDYVPQS